MCILSALINNGTVSMRLIAIGNAFHNRGPTTLNERSPKLTSFVRGTSNRCCCEERVRPVEHCLFSMSARYRGAVPLMHRNTCRSILNSMRRLIGSQCSCLRIGVMWSRRGVKVIIRAAMFCVRWSFFKCSRGSPARSAFPQSNLDMMKARTSDLVASGVR